jgi:hypothetical protein
VVILAGFDKAGADIVFTGRWLGFVLGVAAIGATYALTRALAGKEAGPIAGFAAAFLLAASGPFAMWGSAGLETSLLAVLLVAAVLAHMREQQGDVIPLSGALWAFVLMTHPSGVIAFGVSLVFKAAESATRVRRAGGDRSGPYRVEIRGMAVWLASFAVLFTPYFAWRYTTYGWLLPNTYYAKVSSGIDQYARGLLYANRFMEEYAIWMLLAVPVALFSGSIKRIRSGYVLAIVGAMLAYIVYVGGDSLVRYRFFAPILPLVYAVSVASAAAIARNLRGWDASRPWAAPAAACTAVAALTLFTLQASAGETAVRSERVAVRERVEMGLWMGKNLPATTVVAVVPAGSIPYESRLPSIDMLGLNDEHIAHRHIDLPAIIVGHEKYDSEYVLHRKPEIIILNDHLTRTPWRLTDYGVLASQIITAIPDMLKSPRLAEEYETRSAEISKGNWLNLFVRRDADAVISRTLAPPAAP